jgi:hypothetical protein
MLDELPSLELAATAIALVLVLRALALLRRGSSPVRDGQARAESARARDLVGLAVLAGAVLYALRVQRASTWFLVASGVATLAQLLGFYLRSGTRKRAEAEDEDPPLSACASCGSTSLIELVDTQRLLSGLAAFGPLSATVCPACGALEGQVEDPARIPVGPEHGTALRQTPASEDQEALEEAPEHDG